MDGVSANMDGDVYEGPNGSTFEEGMRESAVNKKMAPRYQIKNCLPHTNGAKTPLLPQHSSALDILSSSSPRGST